MKYNILEALGKKILFFDGGMGSMLQTKGMTPGENTDVWNFTRPEDIVDVHRQYAEAGADIILTNMFGANRLKVAGTGYTVEQLVKQGIANARQVAEEVGAAQGRSIFVAADVAPTGKLLQPLGDLSFDDAYDIFKEIVVAAEEGGADFIHIETMSDTLEVKAAVLAAKENTSLPVFATVTFDQGGKMLTGGNVEAVVALLEGLGVDALGVNCGLGPFQLEQVVADFLRVASVPVIIQPNAGLPRQEKGQTVYDISAEDFAKKMRDFAEDGAWLLGGCCGTTPAHIRCLVAECGDIVPKPLTDKERTVVSSYTHAVEIADDPIIIGERINPTGKSRFKQALRDHDMDYILQEGFGQQDKGAQILDINVGLPEIDETAMILDVVREVQSVIDLPLQIDTSNVEAMEAALRYYNGKAMINSVNGKQESMDAVFPLVKKYGGVVVGLTLDESGIPSTAEGRYAIAEKIVKTAESYGISRKDIVMDVLCMTISSDPQGAVTTLKALQMVKEGLGVRTSLGVSNISFGLPRRDIINANFYAQALAAGLDCAILNTNADGMLQAYHAYRALTGKDENCAAYIENYANTVAPTAGSVPAGAGAGAAVAPAASGSDLERAIVKGMKDQAGHIAAELVKTIPPLELINQQLVPALDIVGKGFEAGTVFLPQLLMSAEAAKSAFEAVRGAMDASGASGQEKKGKIIIATVKGDIHDIGKNIVKVLLENYGYDVCDLGKDVPPEAIVEAAVEGDVKLVGLSALMTTTVTSMEETIRLLSEKKPDCRVVVGGAVLTEQYAEMIHADHYAKDAMATVYYAQEVLG
ncbi:MAG: homocysteine S-methyltransferase family protein [Firmicutes bacterium]|nr:homocysteine S-methyltransferase family protein [Bacillota bacterium]